ncbi:16S rRNA (cytosine(967)-C(5))-methyltransferase RsmB [uncultured Eubacterium sp.]|uniref:16S rRNA (cytosine(967)-C(5))-methyltransferase RsmB n=1 Tax=uncultured Eubacterium sp. TaxID=165185 RepID=UPI00267301ED|nr:16S rRNA (cytosine(967)-C(5))-methyltransferase RsmB [uncultured Eubacterium sp.]
MTKQTSSQINLRNLVLSMLEDVQSGKKSHLVLNKYLNDYITLDKKMRAFITRLFQGTLERQIEIDYIINSFSNTPVKKMKPVICNILRLSVYQLKYMESVPASAVCNEAVKLAVKRKFSGLKGFVNGVLRNIIRNMDSLKYPDEEKENLSIKYSMPKWIIELWDKQYGLEKTNAMLNSVYREKTTTIRCNTSKAGMDEIISNLESSDIKVTQSLLYDKALNISGYDNLSQLDIFKSGIVTVQDLSSMIAGLAANPGKGDYIIDVCAAPGGKSMHMAELMEGTGCVEARDLTEYKVELIRENIARIGCKNVKAEISDATVFDKSSEEKADIVMADLPCSGLGVMNKKSDIKYNVSMTQIRELVQLQREILSVVYRYVKPGGTLIFSTCTVNKFENNENVKWIEENLPFKLKSLKGLIPKELGGEKGYIQIYLGEYDMDGFFISAFERI